MDKYKKELKESNFAKIFSLLLFLVAIVILYSNYYAKVQDLEDYSYVLLGINLTVLSINIATYLNLYHYFINEIEKAKKNKNTNQFNLYIEVQSKRNMLTLSQLILTTLYVCFSGIILIFDMPIYLKNACGFSALFGVLLFLIQLCIHIYSLFKSDKMY